jgi:Cys-tRNA(Pro)/Cys-tRNA(Cys) deacylase
MTPAVEAARAAGIAFTIHEYEGVDPDQPDYAVAVAAALGIEPQRLFKGARMADRAEAERATGYVPGGISPLGQRRRLPTTVDETALDHETVLVSAGRRGLQLELDPRELVRLTDARVEAITRGSPR